MESKSEPALTAQSTPVTSKQQEDEFIEIMENQTPLQEEESSTNDLESQDQSELMAANSNLDIEAASSDDTIESTQRSIEMIHQTIPHGMFSSIMLVLKFCLFYFQTSVSSSLIVHPSFHCKRAKMASRFVKVTKNAVKSKFARPRRSSVPSRYSV